MNSAIVVGGGILGTATAWHLAEYGVDVTLLEAGATLGDGASRASFAWLNASNKPPQNYHQLNVDGMSYYRRLERELGDPRWLHFDGHVEWDGSEGGPDLLRQKVERLRNWGYTAELLPISELASLEPDLVAPANVDEFAYFPHEGYINPVDMIGDFAAQARAAGVTIMTHTRVTELVTEGDRVVGVTTAQGDRLLADTVVSCTGSVTPYLLDQLGVGLPMAPTTGMVAVSSPTSVRLNSVHHDHLMNIRPDGSGRIMMRHYDFDDMVTPETPETPIPAFMNQLLERVVTVLPGLASARIDSIRITTRPIPGDGHPVIGAIPGLDGLYVMVTHSGVTMGPLLGHIAAREITTGASDSRLDAFRPNRAITVSRKPIREN
jgi:glycine/D-amino acid oxidase-like deaminating enzyme